MMMSELRGVYRYPTSLQSLQTCSFAQTVLLILSLQQQIAVW
jgi:hypothetical protein